MLDGMRKSEQRLLDQRPPIEPNIGAVVDRLVGELFGALANNLAPLPLPMTKEQLEAKARMRTAWTKG